MKVYKSIDEVRNANIDGCAFVPTMGALHAGHLSLIRQGSQLGLPVGVSIFVNPLQFGKGEDFDKYPRDLERDAALVESAGAQFVFAPSREEMFSSITTQVHVPEVTELYEGALRPGHFDGVATVVHKLFNIVQPSHALFGLKDLQQCMVLSRMVSDLQVPVTLAFCSTIREADGLAMSSRNAYLSADERSIAPEIYHQLTSAKSALLAGEDVSATLSRSRDALNRVGFGLQYFDLIDKKTFSPSLEINEESALIVAAKLNSTRLIDNLCFDDAQYV